MLDRMSTYRAIGKPGAPAGGVKRRSAVRAAWLVVGTVATVFAAGAGLVTGANAGPVRESDYLLSRGEALAAGCTPCHQDAPSPIPALTGQSSGELRAKLAAFRDGTRGGTVMPQLVRGYAPAELDALAAWFARRHEAHDTGSPADPSGVERSVRSGR